MKKSNIGILIGVILAIVALIAVLSFSSSCQNRTRLDTSVFEDVIGITVVETEDGSVEYNYSGKVDLAKISGIDQNTYDLGKSSITRIITNQYDITMTVKLIRKASGNAVTRSFSIVQRYGSTEIYAKAIKKINQNIEAANANLAEEDKLPLISENFSDPNSGSLWASIIPYLIMGAIMIIAIIFINRSITGGTKGAMNFSKTNARQTQNIKVRFTDVAGAEEEKEELQEVVEFLKNPKKFTELGARIPKGVLLVGPPGTGKTLFAKAVAGEAGVPFFSISGSDFVEVFVGVGASRVRDLFDAAKKNQPCIVFIDELDAVGHKRGSGFSSGHNEMEQTLNQLLVQMDGFETNEGIIVMGATNRVDILDPALMRPGRFDRQIFVNLPDVRGREAILKVHSRNKPMAPDVNFKTVARMTSGFSGADIENLLNEAAIFAVRANRKQITNKDLYEGINKVLLGPQKKSRLVTETDKRITAYHEAGHAILAKLLPHCDPVHEVSIIPRGHAAGYTMTRPDNDDDHLTKAKLLDDIVMTLGGRVAEELIIKDISAGASGDIQAVTKRARLMVTEWGMSDRVGPINYANDDQDSLVVSNKYSDKTAAIIDEEINKIVDSSLQKARELLSANKKVLDNMARLLVERETIFTEEVDMLMQGASIEEIEKFMDDNELRLQEDPFRRKNSVIVEEPKTKETGEDKTETKDEKTQDNSTEEGGKNADKDDTKGE